jgi:membrane protein YdbS with pleckstrin-like domain
MNSFSNVPIDFNSIPQAEKINFRPIEKKYMMVNIISSLFTYILIAGIAIGFLYITKKENPNILDYLPHVLIVIGTIYILNVILIIAAFKWKGYVIREKDIIYRKGLIWRKRVHIPFNRVQHCEVAQSLIERSTDLAKLKIYTAGGSKSDLSVPGLLQEDALKMKQFILKKSEEHDAIKTYDDESE